MDHYSDSDKLLQSCLEIYQDAGIPCRLIEPSADAAYPSLVLSFSLNGQSGRTVQTEINFIPDLASAEEGLHMLQIFASTLDLGGDRGGRRAGYSFSPELYRLINRINLNLPLGAFGIMEEASLIFYKINSMIDTNQSPAWNTQWIDRHNGLLIHIHNLFIDALEEAASGTLSYEEAVSRLKLL